MWLLALVGSEEVSRSKSYVRTFSSVNKLHKIVLWLENFSTYRRGDKEKCCMIATMLILTLFATEEGDLTIVLFSFSVQSKYHIGMECGII